MQFVHGDLVGSQTAAAQALAQFTGKDPAWEWRFRFLDASILLWQSKSDEALALLQSELPGSLPASEYAVQRYEIRAFALARLGKLPSAEKEARESLKLAIETRSPFRAEACHAVGNVDIELNNLAEASAVLQEGRAAAHERSDNFLEAKLLINQSVVALRQEHYDEAFEYLNSATALARSAGAALLLENTLGNTGWRYHEIGDHERARANLAEAAEEAEKLGNKLDEVRWLNNLGVEQWALNDLNGAEASFRKALPLAESIHSDRETISVEMDLASLLFDKKNYDEAARICETALPAAHDNHNTATEMDLIDLKAALAANRGDQKEALSDYLQVEEHPEAWPSQRLEAENALAGLYDKSGQTTQAETWYRKAVSTFEKQRATIRDEETRLPFFANAEDVYPDFAEFLIHHHRNEEALKLVDTGRARALEEGLGLKAGGASATVRTDIAPRALAAKLHSVLLEYALGEKESWLWVATPQQLKLVQLPAKAEIAAQVAAYRKAILNADDVLATRNAAGIALYDSLIAPVQEMIPAQSRVFVLPDGVLNELNFETLLVSKPEPHFWIDDVTVENANSLRMLNSFANHGTLKKPASLLLIGDPVAPTGEFNDLLNAPQEVSAVANHFPPDHRVVLTRDKASPRAYSESHPERFTYIDFVAHGTASKLEPLESAVVLSGTRVLLRTIVSWRGTSSASRSMPTWSPSPPVTDRARANMQARDCWGFPGRFFGPAHTAWSGHCGRSATCRPRS